MPLSGNRKSKAARVAILAAAAMTFTAVAVAGLSLRIYGEISLLLTALASLSSGFVTVPVVVLILAQIEKCELAHDDLVAVRRELSIIRREFETAAPQCEPVEVAAEPGSVADSVKAVAARLPVRIAA
ncbi:MAG: hypothetical protein RIA09_16425 [Hoeflea sp.]|uniref:hypothetical protein n=1 Tax=Hoeflea sp. TaxID=1940281 RepID=UPI0032ED5B72